MAWSPLAGTSRLHEAPRPPGGLAGSSGPSLVARARLLACVAGAVAVWGAAGLLAGRLDGRVGGLALAPWIALPALLALALLVPARRRGGAWLTLAGLAGTLALVLAVAGHALAPWGGPVLALLPTSGAWGWTLGLAAALLAPLLAGARLAALERAFDASGKRAGLALTLRVVLDAPGRLPRHLVRGWSLAGVALLDLATLPLRPRDRLHAEADLDALAAALTENGASCERDGSALVVRLPPRAEGALSPALRVRASRLAFPALARGAHLDVRGDAAEARRLRAWLEGPCCHALVFSWSDAGVRLERRLNAMLREAQGAATLEERSVLMEEASRLASVLLERDLNGEEHAILATLKGQRLRGLLATRMLSEPPGSRPEGRVLAPAAAMAPPLSRVLDAGGLSAVKRLVFLPHWVLPVATPWGEGEVLVNALTGKPDPDGPALLDAMRRRAPTHFLDAGSRAQFLPAPAPNAALLHEVRGLGAVAHAPAALELVYVPFVGAAEGYVNAVTGGAPLDPALLSAPA